MHSSSTSASYSGETSSVSSDGSSVSSDDACSSTTLSHHSVPHEAVHLPDGTDTRLYDIAMALGRVAPDDLTLRPALQIVEATRVIEAARVGSTCPDACSSPDEVPGYLACAASILKSVIASVIDIPQSELPQAALLSREEILGMAQSLRSDLCAVVLASGAPDVEVCEFERSMRGTFGSAAVAEMVKKTGVFIKRIDDASAPNVATLDGSNDGQACPPPDVTLAFTKLQQTQLLAHGELVADDEDDDMVVHRSPHLHRPVASEEEKFSMIAAILPKQLNKGLVASARVPLRWLRETTFAFDRDDGRLQAHFAVEEWEAPLTFHPAAAAAAEKVAKALKQPSTQPKNPAPSGCEVEEKAAGRQNAKPENGDDDAKSQSPEERQAEEELRQDCARHEEVSRQQLVEERQAEEELRQDCARPEEVSRQQLVEEEQAERRVVAQEREAAERKQLDEEEAAERMQLGADRADAERRQRLPPEERHREEMAALEAKIAAKVEAAVKAAVKAVRTEAEARAEAMKAEVEAVRAEAEAMKAEVEAVRAEAEAKAEAMKAEVVEAVRAEVNEKIDADRLVAKVNAAKDEYCDAVLNAMDLPMPLLRALHATFNESQNPTATVEADKKMSNEQPRTVVSGCCPIRTAALAVSASNTGFVLGSWAHLERLRSQCFDGACTHSTKHLYLDLLKIATRVRGECRKCGVSGKCVAWNGRTACVGSQEWRTFKRQLRQEETKVNIIPHAAANYVETQRLLELIDATPYAFPAGYVEYLALPHNIFYLSSCFESFFNRGALVFVKIGPPECQFYRVTTTEKAAVANFDFGADVQMQKLFSHIGLSCIDGLVVDLARPAKVISRDGVENEIAGVSHRYLDLHARAHHPSLRKKPLLSHVFKVSPAALATKAKKLVVMDKNAIRARYPKQGAQGKAITIEEWLDELENA